MTEYEAKEGVSFQLLQHINAVSVTALDRGL